MQNTDDVLKTVKLAHEMQKYLQERFSDFARSACEWLESDNGYPGVKTENRESEGYFDVEVAGRTLRIAFTSHLSDHDEEDQDDQEDQYKLIGKATCYHLRYAWEAKDPRRDQYVERGSFLFTDHGITNIPKIRSRSINLSSKDAKGPAAAYLIASALEKDKA